MANQNKNDGGEFGHSLRGRARKAASGAVWSILRILVETVLAVAVFVFSSRILTPYEFGVVALAVSIIMIASNLIPSPFGEALIQRKEVDKDHLDSVFWLTSSIAVVCFTFCVLAAPFLAEVLDTPILRWVLPVIATRMIFDAMVTAPQALVVRRMEFRTITIRTVVANGLGSIVCFILLFTGAALWALVISQIVTSLTSCIVTFSAARWRPRLAFSTASIRDLQTFGLQAMGLKLITRSRLDQLLLGVVLGAGQLGFFFFARRIQTLLLNFTAGALQPVTTVLFASMQGETTKPQEVFSKSSFIAAGIGFPVFVGLIMVAPTAVPLVFGDQWEMAIFPLQCSASIALIKVIGTLLATAMRNLGYQDWWFNFQILNQLLGLGLILLFAQYGLNVVMAVLLLKDMAIWPLAYSKTLQVLQMSFQTSISALVPSVSAVILMILALTALTWFFPDLQGILLFFSQIVLGLVAYSLGLIALGWEQISDIYESLRNRPKSSSAA